MGSVSAQNTYFSCLIVSCMNEVLHSSKSDHLVSPWKDGMSILHFNNLICYTKWMIWFFVFISHPIYLRVWKNCPLFASTEAANNVKKHVCGQHPGSLQWLGQQVHGLWLKLKSPDLNQKCQTKIDLSSIQHN